MPMTVEIPESVAVQIRSALELTNCKDEGEFVFKAIQTQLKTIKKYSSAATQIKKWLEQANLDETEVQKDFDVFKENLSREQFFREQK